MYKVLLLDDEIWTVKGLCAIIVWEDYGFTVELATTDSKEALDALVSKHFDVVFTDIRMPEMSGIELITKAKEQGVKSKFVVISGFEDFEYARAAMRSGALDYCTKPVKAEDIINLLGSIKKQLDANESHKPTDIININFKELIRYINENYNQKLLLAELAETFMLSPNYCCNLFRKHFNCSFSDYIAQTRMKQAEKLLLDFSLTVEQIATKVGYEDYFYFNKRFKQIYGVTPAQYRKSANLEN